VFVDQHYSLGKYADCLEIGSGSPLWLQYIHGGNLANRVNGLPLRRVEQVRQRFTVDIEPVPATWRDQLAAAGRVTYRTVRHPSKLRGPARVILSKVPGSRYR
jgi:hypothetical protein